MSKIIKLHNKKKKVELTEVVEPINNLNELIFQSELNGEIVIWRFSDLVGAKTGEVCIVIKGNWYSYSALMKTIVLIDKDKQ